MIEWLIIGGAALLGAKGLKEAFKDEDSARKTLDTLNRGMNIAAKNAEKKYQSGQISEDKYNKFGDIKHDWDENYKNMK